jgi:hypothetical protein
MLAVLFDPGERESALAALAQAGDPVPVGWRAGLADALEGRLLPHVEAFIGKLYESGRGRAAAEFDAADRLRECAGNVARILRLADDGALDAAAVAELADDLAAAWAEFAAEAAAHRMYADLVAEARTLDRAQAKANSERQAVADTALLREFADWQAGRLPWQLAELKPGKRRPRVELADGTVLPAKDRVQRFKRALKKRGLTERQERRLNRLLKEGRIPAP